MQIDIVLYNIKLVKTGTKLIYIGIAFLFTNASHIQHQAKFYGTRYLILKNRFRY